MCSIKRSIFFILRGRKQRLRSKFGCINKGTRSLVTYQRREWHANSQSCNSISLVAPYRCLVLVCWIPFHKQKMSAAASEEILNKRGKVSSPVWQFFGYYKSDRNQTNVVCKLCKTVVPAKTGNTTNLMYHHSRAHPLVYSRIQPTTNVKR